MSLDQAPNFQIPVYLYDLELSNIARKHVLLDSSRNDRSIFLRKLMLLVCVKMCLITIALIPLSASYSFLIFVLTTPIYCWTSIIASVILFGFMYLMQSTFPLNYALLTALFVFESIVIQTTAVHSRIESFVQWSVSCAIFYLLGFFLAEKLSKSRAFFIAALLAIISSGAVMILNMTNNWTSFIPSALAVIVTCIYVPVSLEDVYARYSQEDLVPVVVYLYLSVTNLPLYFFAVIRSKVFRE
eukprot:TRINITY_DN12477_c0_g1_i1.p2 TRINITY_DN12477_c0_g1~~TRINITY_DN12477_c0_g1_i1.p2  ORF type:complete len:243 (+),score=68.04 TRINITY_DN12477_c0_g1_i1:25-753(+)